MNFLILKYIHICAVSVSFALFFVRGLWIMRAYPTIHEFWVRVFPAMVDGVLVLSGLFLLSMSKDRVTDPWMLMKFTLLTRDCAGYLVDRYSERQESAAELSKRVNQRSI